MYRLQAHLMAILASNHCHYHTSHAQYLPEYWTPQQHLHRLARWWEWNTRRLILHILYTGLGWQRARLQAEDPRDLSALTIKWAESNKSYCQFLEIACVQESYYISHTLYDNIQYKVQGTTHLNPLSTLSERSHIRYIEDADGTLSSTVIQRSHTSKAPLA